MDVEEIYFLIVRFILRTFYVICVKRNRFILQNVKHLYCYSGNDYGVTIETMSRLCRHGERVFEEKKCSTENRWKFEMGGSPKNISRTIH